MSSFDYKLSTITKYRAGTASDPYIDITETKKVINNVIQLNEIPVSLNKVKINNMYEAPDTYTGDLTANEYRVDYTEGIIFFHPSAEGKTLTYYYKGRGNHFVSSDRIWTKEQNGEVIETLGEILEAGKDAVGNIKELTELMHETELAKDATIEATKNANQAANSVYDAINNANLVADTLEATNDEIIQAENIRATNEEQRKTNEETRISNEDIRIQQESNRENQEQLRNDAETTRENNEKIRQQQELQRQQDTADAIADAEQATLNTQLVADNTRGAGPYNASSTYSKNNIVTYNGSSYMALESNLTGIIPTNTAKWQLVAQRGVDGNGSVVSVNTISPDLNGNITLSPDDLGAESISNKGVANGYASLDSNGFIPPAQLDLPSNLETVDGSQAKADAAEQQANHYTDTEISNLFGVEQRQDVVLNAGMQILNAQRRAAFSLRGIKGRTLVNLLGRDGNCESISRLTPWQATLTADTTNKTQGSQSLKITTTASPGGSGASTGFPVKAGSYYLIVADVKLGSGTSIGAYINGLTSSKGNTNSTDTTKFKTVWKAYSVSTAATVYAVGEVVGPSGSVGYVDAIRVYEFSAAEYVALDGMTSEQVAAKYPYVDSVQPVRNPYAIRYGENLLPPFYEWTLNNYAVGKIKAMSPYEVSITAAGVAGQYEQISYTVPTIAGTTYTFEKEGTADRINIRFYDNNDSLISNVTNVTDGSNVITFTTPEATTKIMVILNSSVAGEYTIKNPVLALGSEAKPFKPREDAMLALQTDLFADPLTGANADEVFEKDGQYFKLAKWKKVVLDGSQNWGYSEKFTGYKRVGLPFDNSGISNTQKGIKYDGKILINHPDNSFTAADQIVLNTTYQTAKLQLSISNTDSGWGDNYTPTADEIKAYFMGWKMSTVGQGRTTVYNGTGDKVWIKITRMSDSVGLTGNVDYTTTLPTVSAGTDALGNIYTPYQLVYQLATPTVESIVSEGMLTFNEGGNQIEVGTGIVVREPMMIAKAGANATTNDTGTTPPTPFKYRVKTKINIYRDGKVDTGWTFNSVSAYGLEKYYRPYTEYDPSAAYSVTYLMLDTSPIVPFIGSYAANEKSMLQELTDSVQQNATAVSVLMNKKADKDAPGWITPTLLNGWVNFGSGNAVAGFIKAHGFVILKGTITAGAIANGTTILTLPEGYRPKERKLFVVYSNGDTAIIALLADGRLVIDVLTSSAALSLDNIIFLEE